MEKITPDTPIESKKIRTVLAHWRSLKLGTRAPMWSDFDVLDVFTIMPNVMMVDLETNPFRVKFNFVGTQVVRLTGYEFTGKYLDEIMLDDHSAPFVDCYKMAANEETPVLEWCDWILAGGITVSYDFAIFPFISASGEADKAISIECYDRLEKDYSAVERTLGRSP